MTGFCCLRNGKRSSRPRGLAHAGMPYAMPRVRGAWPPADDSWLELGPGRGSEVQSHSMQLAHAHATVRDFASLKLKHFRGDLSQI